jgi:hypothetical protein
MHHSLLCERYKEAYREKGLRVDGVQGARAKTLAVQKPIGQPKRHASRPSAED